MQLISYKITRITYIQKEFAIKILNNKKVVYINIAADVLNNNYLVVVLIRSLIHSHMRRSEKKKKRLNY